MTDPQFRLEVAIAVGRHLRANPPGESNVDDVEVVFAAAIMRTAELVIPPQERRRPERGWSGDAQTEAELQIAADAIHAASQRLKTDTTDAQLRRAARNACKWLKRVGGLSLSDESFPNKGARGAFAKPSRRLHEASMGMAEGFAKPSRSLLARDVFMKHS